MKRWFADRKGVLQIGLLAAACVLPFGLAQSRGGRVIEHFNSGGSHLGIEMDEVTADNMATYKLSAERGVIVRQVEKGSPAADAGVEEKDVVVEYDGMPVVSTMQFTRLVQETPPGRKVSLAVLRDGKRLNLSAKIGKREGPIMFRSERPVPEEREFRFGPGDRTFRFRIPDDDGPFAFSLPRGLESRESRAQIGVTLEGLTDQMAEFLGVPGKRGALVTSVKEGSAAAAAKLRAGDVIVRAGDRAVEDPDEVARAIERSAGGKLDLKLVRDKREITIVVELPKNSGNSRRYRM